MPAETAVAKTNVPTTTSKLSETDLKRSVKKRIKWASIPVTTGSFFGFIGDYFRRLELYHLDTPIRLAAFLGQVGINGLALTFSCHVQTIAIDALTHQVISYRIGAPPGKIQIVLITSQPTPVTGK
jgi:hypothetical protein